MTEYKEIGGQQCYSDDGWKTCQVGIKEPETIGYLSDLVTTNKDTYADYINYYKNYPVKFIEMVLGTKLKWYQRIVLKKLYKTNSR
jgi:hypothetical protein